MAAYWNLVEPSVEEDPMVPAKNKTILVVEDDDQLRDIIVRMLERGGFTALSAPTAVKGLSLYHANHSQIDLAVIDMVMPGMSGLDLAAELGRQQPNLKILYISGYGSSIAMESVQRYSPQSVLTKPFTQKKLIDCIETLCRA
jgi:CheY-like chemotaxis protein